MSDMQQKGDTLQLIFFTNAPTTRFVVECQICRNRSLCIRLLSKKKLAYQGQPPPSSLSVMNAQHTTQFLPQNAWIVDSGAPHHIT